jgi:hypothetical protein
MLPPFLIPSLLEAGPAQSPLEHQFRSEELRDLAALARKHNAQMMFGQYFEELAGTQAVDGTALTASTTATSLLAAPKLTIPANYLSRVGQSVVVIAAGRVSNIVTTPGTLTLDLRFGATVVANGGAMPLNTTAKTNVSWLLWWVLTLRAIGASANFMHQGQWFIGIRSQFARRCDG